MAAASGLATKATKLPTSSGVMNTYGEVLISKGSKFSPKNLTNVDFQNVNPLNWTTDEVTNDLAQASDLSNSDSTKLDPGDVAITVSDDPLHSVEA